MPPPPAGFPLSYQTPAVGNLIGTTTESDVESDGRPPHHQVIIIVE